MAAQQQQAKQVAVTFVMADATGYPARHAGANARAIVLRGDTTLEQLRTIVASDSRVTGAGGGGTREREIRVWGNTRSITAQGQSRIPDPPLRGWTCLTGHSSLLGLRIDDFAAISAPVAPPAAVLPQHQQLQLQLLVETPVQTAAGHGGAAWVWPRDRLRVLDEILQRMLRSRSSMMTAPPSHGHGPAGILGRGAADFDDGDDDDDAEYDDDEFDEQDEAFLRYVQHRLLQQRQPQQQQHFSHHMRGGGGGLPPHMQLHMPMPHLGAGAGPSRATAADTTNALLEQKRRREQEEAAKKEQEQKAVEQQQKDIQEFFAASLKRSTEIPRAGGAGGATTADSSTTAARTATGTSDYNNDDDNDVDLDLDDEYEIGGDVDDAEEEDIDDYDPDEAEFASDNDDE